MKSCLMIMHARDIPECLLSLKALKIDKVWFRGFTEKELEDQIAIFVRTTAYHRYILVSDDVIVTQQALDNLLSLQDSAQVVTGWCNIFPGKLMSNLELKATITGEASLYIRVRDQLPKWSLPIFKKLYEYEGLAWFLDRPLYNHFPTLDEIWAQDKLFRTYFVGWALTSITRELWMKYGFSFPLSGRKKAGHGSDRAMSEALLKDNVVALCARDSFIYHLRTTRNFIVGKSEPKVIFEPIEQLRI